MLYRYFDKRHPAVDLFLDIMLVATLLIAVVNQFQLRNEIHSRQNAAYNNCIGSNDARQVVVNLLVAAEAQVKVSPDLTLKQQQRAIKFYDTQISNIKFADCAPFKD